MSGHVEKHRLADRAEAILRSDRQSLRQRAARENDPAVLLTLVPDVGPIIDLMDAYIPGIADAAGLQYVRLVESNVRELPRHQLERCFLLLADLTGRNEHVVTLVYQALARGRRVLLAAQDTRDLPQDLHSLPFVVYDLETNQFGDFLQAVQNSAVSTLEDCVPLV